MFGKRYKKQLKDFFNKIIQKAIDRYIDRQIFIYLELLKGGKHFHIKTKINKGTFISLLEYITIYVYF